MTSVDLTDEEVADLRALLQAEIRRNIVADDEPTSEYLQRLDSIRDKL